MLVENRYSEVPKIIVIECFSNYMLENDYYQEISCKSNVLVKIKNLYFEWYQ